MTGVLKFYSRQRMWMKIVLLIAAGYAAFCVVLFLMQRSMIYMPSRRQAQLPAGFVPWRSADGTEFWGYKRVAGSDACIFFFHGNGGNASGWSHAVAEFPGDVFVLEYPGYGERPGKPAEKSNKAAALAGFEAESKAYRQVIVAGQSLGAGVTEAIFSRHPERIDRLVLITPFTSIADVARAHFPWFPTGLILRDRYELYEPWRRFGGRTCVVVAGQDEIIPAAQGQRYLEAKADTCRIVQFPEHSHNMIHLDAEFWSDSVLK